MNLPKYFFISVILSYSCFVGFLQFWGIVFTITTTLVAIFKREPDDNEETEGIIDTYKLLVKIVRLPAVISLISILLTAKVMQSILKKHAVSSKLILVQ